MAQLNPTVQSFDMEKLQNHLLFDHDPFHCHDLPETLDPYQSHDMYSLFEPYLDTYWAFDFHQAFETYQSYALYPFLELYPSFHRYQNVGSYQTCDQYQSFSSSFNTTGSRLSPEAPAFVPVNRSKLKPTAPTFLLSRLAIFDPHDDGLQEKRSKHDLILPAARKEDITDALTMLHNTESGQVGRFTKETTYQFNKGWHRNDPVLGEIYAAINSFKKTDFAVFALKPEVRPVNDAPPLWPPGLNQYDIKAYYFDVKDEKTPEEAKFVTLMPLGSPPTMDTIHIYEPEEKEWITFKDWLNTSSTWDSTCEYRSWTGRLGYNLLFKWWKYKRTSRCFFDLPTEIREQIYRVALGGEIYPLSTVASTSQYNTMARREARLTLGLGYHRRLFLLPNHCGPLVYLTAQRHVPEVRTFIYEPDLTLLRVCSRVRDEMLHTGWELMRRRFFDRRIFRDAMDAGVGSAMPYKYLSKIKLNLTNAGYFALFSVELYRGNGWEIVDSKSLGPRIQALDDLKDLQLHFRSPDDGYHGIPWVYQVQNAIDAGHEVICCQRTMVDWICTLAYPFLIDKCKADVLKVTLTGAVKSDTKQKWHGIFRNKQHHDQTKAMEAIFSALQDSLPPSCRCGTPCSFPYASRQEPGCYFRSRETFDPES